MLRPVYVAETTEQARREAEPHLNYFWGKLLSYHQGAAKLLGQSAPQRAPRVSGGRDVPLYEFDYDLTQREGITLAGDPDYVLHAIKAQMREVGAGVLMGLFQFGSLPHELVKKNVELFSKTVLPELRKFQP